MTAIVMYVKGAMPFRMIGVYTLDLLAAALSLVLAFNLRLEGPAASEFLGRVPIAIPLFTAITFCVLHSMRLHRRVWRYSSVSDLIAVAKVSTVSVAAFVILLTMMGQSGWLPRSIPVIQWFVLIFLLGGMRVARRLSREYLDGIVNPPSPALTPANTRRPALLVGNRDEVEQLLRYMERGHGAGFRPIGILDDLGAQSRMDVRGIPIEGSTTELPQVVERLEAAGERPRCLVFASDIERLRGAAMVKLVGQAQSLNLDVAYHPGLAAYKPSTGAPIDFRYMNVADLLGRPQAMLDATAVADMITGQRVLVTGAGGTIGRELVRQIAGFRPARLMLLDANEFNLYEVDLETRENHPDLDRVPLLCSIRQRKQLMQIFERERPEIVFHAAALKHVPLVEQHPAAGIQTNVIGTRNVADAVQRYGARAMVQVSTDKAVNPVGFMGVTKRLGELYCQALDLQGRDDPQASRFMTVRFGNVLGSSGSLIPLFQRQLSRGGPLTVTHPDIERFFMTVHEAVQLVLHSASHGMREGTQHGRIFVLDMGDPVRIMDVAERMIRLAGLEPQVDVDIEVVGLRPGEKLYEELFDHGEERLPSGLSGVFEAEPQAVALPVLTAAFDKLEQASGVGDGQACRAIARQVLAQKVEWMRSSPVVIPQPTLAEAI